MKPWQLIWRHHDAEEQTEVGAVAHLLRHHADPACRPVAASVGGGGLNRDGAASTRRQSGVVVVGRQPWVRAGIFPRRRAAPASVRREYRHPVRTSPSLSAFRGRAAALSLPHPLQTGRYHKELSLSLYHSCDSTTIRRCHDAFDYDGSDRNYDLHSIRLRYDYDTTTTKNWR